MMVSTVGERFPVKVVIHPELLRYVLPRRRASFRRLDQLLRRSRFILEEFRPILLRFREQLVIQVKHDLLIRYEPLNHLPFVLSSEVLEHLHLLPAELTQSFLHFVIDAGEAGDKDLPQLFLLVISFLLLVLHAFQI